MAKYIPGKSKVIIAPNSLIALKKTVKLYFKFISSGVVKKSLKVVGTTKARGVPFTIKTTLPCKR